MVTSIATSYPYKQDKLSIVGHGIDTDTFSPNGAGAPDHSAIILCAGRLSIVKDHPTLVKAAWLLRQRWPEPFRVVIIGGPAIGRDESYAQSLYDNVRELGLEDTVFFEAPVPGEQLPFWYRRCTVHVNLTPQGFVDKVALEAMSCAKPCLVANEGFKETLGKFADDLLFRHGDAEHLAEKLLMLLQRCERDRDEIGQYLHQQVVQLHSLNNLSQSLIEVAHDLRQHQAHGS
jgi:glycosyltransferase involved in cell wall biosynthesis